MTRNMFCSKLEFRVKKKKNPLGDFLYLHYILMGTEQISGK